MLYAFFVFKEDDLWKVIQSGYSYKRMYSGSALTII